MATTTKSPIGGIASTYGDCHHAGMGGGVTLTFMSGSDPRIVKTTCPEPFTTPLAKEDPSLVTLNRCPAVFPPIVHAMVCVDSIELCLHAYESPPDHSPSTQTVKRVVGTQSFA